MSPRQDLNTLNKWLSDNGVDSMSLILLAKEIAISCVDEGIRSEKVHAAMKDEGGYVEVTERFPAVAVAALGFIHKVVEDEKKRLEKTPEDRVINFGIEDAALEDELP